jgi:hypothetical protein
LPPPLPRKKILCIIKFECLIQFELHTLLFCQYTVIISTTSLITVAAADGPQRKGVPDDLAKGVGIGIAIAVGVEVLLYGAYIHLRYLQARCTMSTHWDMDLGSGGEIIREAAGPGGVTQVSVARMLNAAVNVTSAILTIIACALGEEE